MWFQDLWNYDFRRTEMCVIPYGTQEGEISFCAYNTGVGWRNIIEQMRMVATTKDWFDERGRHQIYAGNRPVALPDTLKRRPAGGGRRRQRAFRVVLRQRLRRPLSRPRKAAREADA